MKGREMEVRDMKRSRPTRRRTPLALLLSCAAASALALPWLAAPEARANGESTAFFLPNEAIGTLPGYWVDDAPWWAWLYFAGSCNIVDSQVATTAYVPECLMDAFVVAADGKGFVLLDHPADDDVVRMRVYGDVRLRFDSDLLASGAANIVGSVGALFAEGEASVVIGDRPSDVFALPAADGELALPVAPLAQGAFANFDVVLQGPSGVHGLLRFFDAPGVVMIKQDMP